jgi:hypothetical protein
MEDFEKGDRVLVGTQEWKGTVYRVCKYTVYVKLDKPLEHGRTKGSWPKGVVKKED